MDTTIQGYTLMRLDTIQDMLRKVLDNQESAMLPLQARPAMETEEPAAPNPWGWLTRLKPVLWLAQLLMKHFPAIATIVYMKATGQDAKILLYINGLLGI
jgi:hypothetical protein